MKALKLKSHVLGRIFCGFLLLVSAASYSGCTENSGHAGSISGRPVLPENKTAAVETKMQDDSALKDTVLRYKPDMPIHYSAFPVRGKRPLATLDSIYGIDGARLILTLNRLDEANIRRADTLVVPDKLTDLLSYCPYPYVIDEARSIDKLLLISRRIQAFAAYENGVLVRWGPTSTGRKTKPTPAGLFSANWKAKKTTSTIDSAWVLPYYFNFQSKEGVALHQFSMPGYPASHACVRLLAEDAKWVYYWADQWILSETGQIEAYGTPIIVFDEYRFGKRKPWKHLLEDPDAINISGEEIHELMDKYLTTIKEREEKRKEVIVARKNRSAREPEQF